MLYIKHSCLAREDQPLPINIGERTHLTACPLTDAVIHAQRHIIISNKPAPIGAGCLLLLSPVVRSRQTAREQLLSLRCCRAAQRRALGWPTEQSPAPEAGANQSSCLHSVSLLQPCEHGRTSGAGAWLPPSWPHALCPGGYGGSPGRCVPTSCSLHTGGPDLRS